MNIFHLKLNPNVVFQFIYAGLSTWFLNYYDKMESTYITQACML